MVSNLGNCILACVVLRSTTSAIIAQIAFLLLPRAILDSSDQPSQQTTPILLIVVQWELPQIIQHMIYGYIRVSSDKQTVENQRFEITNFCQKRNLYIDDWRRPSAVLRHITSGSWVAYYARSAKTTSSSAPSSPALGETSS